MTLPQLCLVTDRSRLGSRRTAITALIDLIAAAARAGVDLIQIREPDLDDRTLCGLVKDAVSVTAGTPALVIVNDRPDVALASASAGVHLKAGSCPANRVRSLIPPGWLIGRSVHGVEEARQVEASGDLSYLVLGPVFETISKPGGAAVGLGVLDEAVRLVDVPVLAIGGMTLDTAAAVGRSGAAGLAAIGLFASAADLPANAWKLFVSDLRCEFNTGRRSTM